MKISDVFDVLIGSDHTKVMRKASIPRDYDHYCISIVSTGRTLDLQIHDPKTIALWEEKIRQLIEPNREPQSNSPDRNDRLFERDHELIVHFRDQCPPELDWLWRVTILGRFQDYWDPLAHELKVHEEVAIPDAHLKQRILALVKEASFKRLIPWS